MPMIVLSGPEKSGKSTVAGIIRDQYGARYRHWFGDAPDERFLFALQEDVAAAAVGQLTVWDRSWTCDAAYAALLNRTHRRSFSAPWIGQWLYGRAVDAVGVQCTLLGPSADALAALRIPDDLPTDPAEERATYARLSADHGILTVENDHTPGYAAGLAGGLVERAYAVLGGDCGAPLPPAWAGPQRPRVVLVGERFSDNPGVRGAWLPMTSRYGLQLAEAIGPAFSRCGWTNAADELGERVLRVGTAIALGAVAARWLRGIGHPRTVEFAHPSAVYRWGRYTGERTEYARSIRNTVAEALMEDNDGDQGGAAHPIGGQPTAHRIPA
jgi:hypothetical protein